MYDLVIIGAGVAGLTAGIYGVRAELKTLLVEAKLPGGQIAEAGLVENYPGFPDGIVGMQLAEQMRMQAEKAGVEFKTFEEVLKIEKKDNFVVTTNSTAYEAKAVIIATGMRHKKLGIKGEDEFTGKGVSYCATCDAPLFKGKKVAVAGGGTAAVMAALYLCDVAKEVKLITQRDKIAPAEKIMETRLRKSKTEIILYTKVKEIFGDRLVRGIKVQNLKTGTEATLDIDGIFVEVGKIPNTAFLKNLGVKMENGYIVVDRYQRTNIPGLFGAGDVTNNKVKQVGIAVAQGSAAALEAYEYIKTLPR